MKRGAIVLGALLLGPALARAQSADAKRYFEAGAAAYSAGDYQASVQALDAAYRLQPMPAIAFSLAQAERRQYFASQDPQHLSRAIELYRAYLAAVPTGGRRADATDALAQLEPIALSKAGEPRAERAEASPRASAQTRLLVRSRAPEARISLDSAAPVAPPLIAETTPGAHHLRVEAPGFFPAEQDVVAIAGELVPLEVELREKPALLAVKGRDGADVYVDGVPAIFTEPGETVSLRAGTHSVVFAKTGHRIQSVTVTLKRGEVREVRPELLWSKQRVAAVSLFITGGASIVAGAIFTGLAVGQENKATSIEEGRAAGTITPSDRDAYADAVEMRDRYRAIAVGSFVVGASAMLTGVFLHQFDEPNPREVPSRAAFRVNVRPEMGGGLGLSVSGSL
jgi:hypothetical protein